jgi:hypothetical protein
MLGQSSETKAPNGRRAGYDYLHTALDDHSRYSYVEVHPDERGTTCAGSSLGPPVTPERSAFGSSA